MQILFWLYIYFEPCMEPLHEFYFTVDSIGSNEQEILNNQKGGRKRKKFLLSFSLKIVFLEKLENILQNRRVVKSMQGYTLATLHFRSPGCDQKWHIQSFLAWFQ